MKNNKTKSWYQFMKSLAVGLRYVGKLRLNGWDQRDNYDWWFDTASQ